MTTEAFVGDIFLYRGGSGSPASPQTFTKVCQVFGMSGLGQTNALVDATTFCSAGSREYIGGLADGAEMTVECNYESDATVLFAMIADVTGKVTRSFQVRDESGSPQVVFSFDAACLGWSLNPSVDDRNTITFTLKISGAITIS
jgi:hypothetical protein